ncbi:MAG: hypothetical protein IT373_29945 [Polyangiaceae bacterium]|nr:hypothetical protein [Polyangiaceae bacterium]
MARAGRWGQGGGEGARLRRLVVAGGIPAALVASACFGVSYTKVDAEPLACAPFTLLPPGACDPSLLADADNCCVAGRSCLGGACAAGRCGADQVSMTPTAEAIGLVLVGERVIWTTGGGGELLKTNLDGSAGAAVIANHSGLGGCGLGGLDDCFATEATTDGERVYWVEYNGPEVWSIDPDVPFSSARRVALTASPSLHLAGYGHITVVGQRLFWATERYDDGTNLLEGGVWTADKGSVDENAQAVTTAGQPFGVAADDTDLYWTDRDGAVLRLARADIGQAVTPQTFATQQNWLGAIRLHGDEVIWADGASVRAKKKDGTNERTLGGSSGPVYGIAVEGDYVYWASRDANTVHRASLSSGASETLATVTAAVTPAVGCDALYLSANPDASPGVVYRLRK